MTTRRWIAIWSMGLAMGALLALSLPAIGQDKPKAEPFNGLDMHLGNLYRLSPAKTRSLSAENFNGEKGQGGMATKGSASGAAKNLGQGWKVSPFVKIKKGETFTAANVDGPGAIQQIWITPSPIKDCRLYILRFYWDGEEEPSVEVPLCDFFGCGWEKYCQINSLPVCVNPGSAFNCQWIMPFKRHCKITLENKSDKEMVFFYQINYTLTDVPDDAAYFHAQFRRVPKVKEKDVYTILDGVKGRGQYVGSYMAWETKEPTWWGEGEIKFFMDGDKDFPTICGTGTEDYFLGSYGFVNLDIKLYVEYSTPYAGMPQVLPPNALFVTPQRFGLYRWHLPDPIRFEQDLKITMQALGWFIDGPNKGRYKPLEDDIASVAYWYQTEPHAKFPSLPSKEVLRVKPLEEKKESKNKEKK